jgi:hypothetical protein
MLTATAETGSLVLNIKNRAANRGSLREQRHPYVWTKPNAAEIAGRN